MFFSRFSRYSATLLLCVLSIMASANPNIDSLKKLGREKLIQLAVEKLNDSAFDPTHYDRIIVKANVQSLIVEFTLSIVVSKKSSCFYDAVYVALAGSGTGKSIEGFCDEPEYYSAPESDRKIVDFVFDAINKSTEIGHIPDRKLRAGTSMKIALHLTYYFVEVSNWSTFSHYKVNRVTGKISESEHKHYVRDEDEKDDFEIIK
jgi:hypothetical protein